MPRLKPYCFLYSFLVLVMPVYATDAQPSPPALEWCLDHLPPRQYYQSGQVPTGPMVDFMQQLAKDSGFTLTFSPPTPSARCLKLMEQGKTDLMMGLLWTAEREHRMLLLPTVEARPNALFVRQQGPLFNEVEALRHHQIVLVKQRTYNAEFINMLQQQQVQLLWAEDLPQALAMVHFGKAHAMVGPQHITEHLIAQNPRLKVSLQPNPWQFPSHKSTQNHLAISRLSPHFDLHHRIQLALTALLKSSPPDFYQRTPTQQAPEQPAVKL